MCRSVNSCGHCSNAEIEDGLSRSCLPERSSTLPSSVTVTPLLVLVVVLLVLVLVLVVLLLLSMRTTDAGRCVVLTAKER